MATEQLESAQSDKNRQDFSHCEANVKSRLDAALRRGSGEREAWVGAEVVQEWGEVLVTGVREEILAE